MKDSHRQQEKRLRILKAEILTHQTPRTDMRIMPQKRAVMAIATLLSLAWASSPWRKSCARSSTIPE